MISDVVWEALIAGLPATLTAGVGVYVSIRNANAIRETHLSINSRMTELIDKTRAEAVLHATATEKERVAEGLPSVVPPLTQQPFIPEPK